MSMLYQKSRLNCALLPFALATLSVLLPQHASAQQAVVQLPGGANALQETYQDWTVICGAGPSGKTCLMSQVQLQQNGQRLLAIEIRRGAGEKIEGLLALPFGLDLPSGAGVKIDKDRDLGHLRFSTCVPGGCLVRLELAEEDIAAMRKAASLSINAAAAETMQPVSLSGSLKGYSAAFDRLAELTKR